MTPTDNQARHLKYGRFGRSSAGQGQRPDHSQGRRRGHWTGYRPLEDAVTQARLAALAASSDRETEGQP
jgi:hypothetical protein